MKAPTLAQIETKALDAIGAALPWAAPVVNAYVVYDNLTRVLSIPAPFAVAAAATVDGLGWVAAGLSMRLYNWNRTKPAGAPKGLTIIPVMVAAAYVALVYQLTIGLTDNVTMGVFPFLSILAMVLAAVRQDQVRRELHVTQAAQDESASRAEIQAANERRERWQAEQDATERRERRELRYQLKLAEINANGTPTAQNGTPMARRGTYNDYKAAQLAQPGELMPVDLIESIYGVPRRTAYNWREKYSRNGNGKHGNDSE